MPGIYTHNFIFRRAMENTVKSRGRSQALRSLEVLFSHGEHVRAGFFGAIGPDIFDYMNFFDRGAIYGNEISFHLHDSGCASYISHMTDIVLAQRDSRNEWASIQRAYLLGYLSHIIADAYIHPFSFYFSGFPAGFSRGEIIHFRKANLRFLYNIDNYYLYRSELSVPYSMSLEEMLPSADRRGRLNMWPQVKVLILEALKRENSHLLGRNFPALAGNHIDGDTGRLRNFDRIPANIQLCYKLKRSVNERLVKLMDRLSQSRLFYSDLFVRYPMPKFVDQDALNIHQARWQYPAKQRGFRYESVPAIVKQAVDRITEVWIALEEAVIKGGGFEAKDLFQLNAYTGEKDALYSDMKIKDVIKLRI